MNEEYNELAQLVWDVKVGNKTIDEVIAWISITDRLIEVVEEDDGDDEWSDEELTAIELDCFGVIDNDDFV